MSSCSVFGASRPSEKCSVPTVPARTNIPFRPHASISTPLHCDVLDVKARPEQFTVRTLPARLDALREDPWKGYGRLRQRLPKVP